MNLLRERPVERERAPRAGTPAGAGGQLNNVREEAQRFHAAGDDAIRRALSGSSETFLEATRQQGGE